MNGWSGDASGQSKSYFFMPKDCCVHHGGDAVGIALVDLIREPSSRTSVPDLGQQPGLVWAKPDLMATNDSRVNRSQSAPRRGTRTPDDLRSRV